MKALALLFFIGVTWSSGADHTYPLELAPRYFELFVHTYDKHYATKAEEAKRFEIFKHNLELINQKNSEAGDSVFGITKFSDLTSEEFISIYTGFRGDMQSVTPDCQDSSTNATTSPDSWDWNEKGVVSKVKDQGMCGSCWAFSAIGNVEAYYAIKHQELLDLSEQQLVDCDKNSSGCFGTSALQYPFLYLMKSTGAMQEQDYPYIGQDGRCKFDASKVKAKVSNCNKYSEKDEDILKNIVYSVGPLSIAVDATTFQSYKGHVLENCPFKKLNHAVLLVGYGTENGIPFWLIKNSWGENYGEKGYIKIKRGVNACGLMNDVMVQGVVD